MPCPVKVVGILKTHFVPQQQVQIDTLNCGTRRICLRNDVVKSEGKREGRQISKKGLKTR